jgi:hypothetical protein
MFLTTDAQPLNALAPNPSIDSFCEIVAFEVPPPEISALLPILSGAERAAASRSDASDSEEPAPDVAAASTPVATPAPAPPIPAKDRRIVVRLYHVTGPAGSEDDTTVNPVNMSAQFVYRDSGKRGPPTVIGLPHSVSVGVLRLAIARAVWPTVNRSHLRRALDVGAGVGDEELIWGLAQSLPLLSWTERTAPATWLPTFTDRIPASHEIDGPVRDARSIPLTGPGAVLGILRYVAVGEVVELCAAWRGRFSKVFSHSLAKDFSPTPSMSTMTRSIESRFGSCLSEWWF